MLYLTGIFAVVEAPFLKHSVYPCRKHRTTPFQSGMSMPTSYVNRVGIKLPRKRKRISELAKSELVALTENQTNIMHNGEQSSE